MRPAGGFLVRGPSVTAPPTSGISQGSRLSRIRGCWSATRSFVAIVLPVAAVLKGHQLATEPVAGDSLFTYRWSMVLQVEFELALGLWLLSGLWRRLAWATALVCFVFFSGVTLHKGLSGETSCACFGVVEVSPWITLALDLSIVTLLAIFHPPLRSRQTTTRPRWRLGLAAAALAAVGVPLGLAGALYRPAELGPDGKIVGSERFVVLRPEKWVGGAFPLARHIDVGKQLAGGLWTVVLYHHDCPDCKRVLPQYEKAARESRQSLQAPRVALIELPPYRPKEQPSRSQPTGSACLHGRLSDVRQWFVATPAVVSLVEGDVVKVEVEPTDVHVLGSGEVPMGQPELELALGGPARVEAEHDFGFVEPLSTHKVVLELRNSETEPLRFTSMRSECRCMSALVASDEIPPRGATRMQVTLKAPKDPTSYSKRVLLATGEGGARPALSVRISARVGLPLEVRPATLDLGKVAADKEVSGQVTLLNSGQKAVRPIYATSSSGGCIVQVPRADVPAGGSLAIPVVLRTAGTSAGPGKATVAIHTDCKEQPQVHVTVVYEVGEVTVSGLDSRESMP